jgi:hypothetical protein
LPNPANLPISATIATAVTAAATTPINMLRDLRPRRPEIS